jgi:benzoyl-CoA reductase/2-hydroxyglutaryl-CoA dehydratase subunit BcrC/BadD/HgdB
MSNHGSKEGLNRLLACFHDAKRDAVVELERAQALGKKIVGMYCLFAPVELIWSLGAIPVGLCGTSEVPIPDAEKILPRNLCPLIKSSYGFAITDTCPFFRLADCIIAEATCDGKKKMFELLGREKPLFLMDMPQKREGAEALTYWISEIKRMASFLEEQLECKIDERHLKRSIKAMNEQRMLFQQILGLFKGNPPLTGMDMNALVEATFFQPDPGKTLNLLKDLLTHLKRCESEGELSGNRRILLTGCPVGSGSEKVLELIEELGGLVVCQESCSGIRSFNFTVDEGKGPFESLAEKYLDIPCASMTPNTRRLELIDRLIRKYNIHGVVDLTWQACHTFNVESYRVKEHVENTFQLPYLHIETDYSLYDREQLRTRIEAFLEMIN